MAIFLRREHYLRIAALITFTGMSWATSKSVKDLTSIAAFYIGQSVSDNIPGTPDGRQITGDILTIIEANVPAGSGVLYWYADDIYDLAASRRLLLRASYYHPVRFYVCDATRLNTCDYAVMVSSFASDFQRMCAAQGQAESFTRVATTRNHTLFKRIQNSATDHARRH